MFFIDILNVMLDNVMNISLLDCVIKKIEMLSVYIEVIIIGFLIVLIIICMIYIYICV